MAVVKHNKIKLREVNRHLVCRLCRGYYIDATTIAECLHSFCRSCIIKYLEKNSFCPVCEVQIHKTKPYLNLRLDKALQDVVYKLVPGLYHDEMKRRREFYAKNQDQLPTTTAEQCGLEERIIFSPDDSISLSLEYSESDDFESETVSSQCSESSSADNQDSLSFPQQLGLMKLKNNEGKSSRRESQDVQESSTSFPKRYLQCPAVVSVFHLKKFIRMKHDLTERMQVDIVHKRVPLPDHYTLMDVAYIYTWKRSAPLRFFYQIYETKRQRGKMPNSFFISDESKSKSEAEADNSVPLANGENGVTCNGKSECADVLGEKSEKNGLAVAKVKTETNGFEAVGSKSLEKDTKAFAATESTKICTDICKNGVDKSKKSETTGEKSSVERIANGVGLNGGQTCRPEVKSVSDGLTKENKSDKSESGGGIKSSEMKNKTEKRENKKQQVMCNVTRDEKTSANGSDRLLLNPISGQLESVPSTNANKSSTKTEAIPMPKTTIPEGTNSSKKPVGEQTKAKAKSIGEGQKEVKKSNVNLLKSFRKEKSMGNGKDGKGHENALTITAVGKATEKPAAEKQGAKVSVEIKPEKKESEYDFDGTSPPSKIIPLQEYSKMSKCQKQPQNSWMSLQDFRLQMLKENNSNGGDETGRKDKRKSVPSLFRIGADGSKGNSKGGNPNGKPPTTTTTTTMTTTATTAAGAATGDKTKSKMSPPTIINIKTENQNNNSKTEIKIEVPVKELSSSSSSSPGTPKAIKMAASAKETAVSPTTTKVEDNKFGECVVKPKEEVEAKKTVGASVTNPPTPKEVKKPEAEEGEEEKEKEKIASKDQPGKRNSQDKPETDIATKKSKSNAEERRNKDNFGAIDLSKSDAGPKPGKNPLENLMDLANKSGSPKSDENMVEALISAAQKQSIEPLLKIPQYSQNLKNSIGQGSPPLGKTISSTDISQALQFFKDLRSDIKVLEAKSQLSPNSFLEQFAQKSANLEPIQLYQQHIDLIRRLKRQQMSANAEAETPQRKKAKLSPTGESKRKLSPEGNSKMSEEAAAQLKSSLERTLSQIQEQMEIQSRMVAAQNYKNLPALLQFYNRPPPTAFCPAPPSSPSKSSGHNKLKSSRSPTSQKSPPMPRTSPPGNLTPPGPGTLSLAIANPESPFFAAQKYNHLINAGLNSEMTFHQMFQNYLNQQDKMNQIKHSANLGKKPQSLVPPKTVPELFYASQVAGKKPPEAGTVSAVQKT